MSEPASALLITGLSKTYRYGPFLRSRRVGVADLSLEIAVGEVFGCVGPNGSGKTTTLKSLLGIIRPDAGRITVLGLPHQDPSWRRRTGFLPEHPYFYD
jgi:ABC-2 type transport system ATP-binding protein